MHGFETAKLTVASGRRCQDQVSVIHFESGVVIAVADGAGGTGNGDVAARTVIAEISSAAAMTLDQAGWCSLLRQIDHRIGAGESTCVVLSVSREGISGASVGDSQAWLIQDSVIDNLTRNQIRKPLLGSGEAQPVGFTHAASPALLLVSTDGFSNYIRKDRFLREYLWHDLAVLPAKMVEMVRLPSGDLWDDIGIVVCKPRPPDRRHVRYDLDDN